MNIFEHERQWVPAVILSSGLLVLAVVAAAAYYFLLPQSIKAVSVSEGQEVTLDQIVTVRFDRPVNRKLLQATIEPAVAGTWQFHDMLVGRHFAQAISFIPDTIFEPGTDYHITLNGITTVLKFGARKAFDLSFAAAPLPAVTAMSPVDNATDVTTTAQLVFTLDQQPGDFVAWRLVSDPQIKATQTTNGHELFFTPTESLSQGTLYRWRLERTLKATSRSTGTVIEQGSPERVAQGNFEVLPPPSITAISPTGNHARVDEPVVITFARPMDTASVMQRLTLKPAFTYEPVWSKGDTILTLTPAVPLTFATKYTLTIGAGAADMVGGFLDKKIALSFTTIGPVTVTAMSPSGAGATLGAPIRVDFDQPVDHGSAQGHFSLKPEVSGAFSWDELTLIFMPDQNWSYDTTYTITIADGVASIDGQPSKRAFVGSFATQPQTTLLQIAVDYQDRPLSCEAAALKMALAYKGVSVSEGMIMSYVGYNTTGARQGTIWGDPYLGFVGDIDGHQNTTGYGVYWDPIAAAGGHWRSTEAFTNWTTEQILTAIAAGDPVVLWGIYPGGYYDPWQTAAGKPITAWKGEHARTIVGFVGTPADPEQIIINDPISGRLYWSRGTFEANAATFHFSGVVVH